VTARDAFGNPIEDHGPTTVAAPLAPATATFVPAPRPQPPVRGTFDVFDKLAGLLLLAVIVVPLAIGGWAAWSAWHDTAKPAIDAIHAVTRQATNAAPAPAPATAPRHAGAPPRGLGAGSLLRPAAVARALASARRDPGGRLALIRLAPERADLQLARSGGGLDLLQLRHDGGRSLVRTPGTPPAATIPFAAVDRSAPQRLVRAAAARLHRPASAVDYVVGLELLGAVGWSAYFRGGAAFQADAHGRTARRIQ
jgi:hypothetical protein